MLRILIADDHTIMRTGLRDLLLDHYPSAYIEEAKDGDEMMQAAKSGDWSLIVSDVTMPGQGSMEVIHHLRQQFPKLPILVLSMHPEENYAVRLLKAGASGYINKKEASYELIKAVEMVLQGRKFISSTIAERLAEGLLDQSDRPKHDLLSAREFDVFKMIACGKTPTEISEQLVISITTVSTYRSRILHRLQVKTNADITRYAMNNGLIE